MRLAVQLIRHGGVGIQGQRYFIGDGLGGVGRMLGMEPSCMWIGIECPGI
jgi:hypothetical protein